MRILSVVVLIALVACQEAPRPGLAADPSRAQAPGPWGSSTSNQELDIKRELLTDVLDGKITAEQLPGRLQQSFPKQTDEQRKAGVASIAELMTMLQASGRLGQVMPAGPDRDFAFAQLYFGDRRFIEAGALLSTVLDRQPNYPRARNLLARCFFFLGNRERTLAELQVILESKEAQSDKQEVLDALFLMGAAVMETPGMSRTDLQRGVGAWQTYLKLVTDLPPAQVKQMNEGIAAMEAGLRGEGALAQPNVPVQREDDGGAADAKGVLGGQKAATPTAPSQPSTNGGTRVQALAADASEMARAVAGGLDALDAKDIGNAERLLAQALQLDANAVEAITGMARVRVQQGRIDDALRGFGEAIKRNPTYVPAWHYNGMAHMMAGAPNEAASSWEKIRTLDPAYFAKFNLDKRIEVAKRMTGQ
jgi:tetratricopeptide (TPR) repeat protein